MDGGGDQLTSWRDDLGFAASDAAPRGVRARMTSTMARTGEAAPQEKTQEALAGSGVSANCGDCHGTHTLNLKIDLPLKIIAICYDNYR